MFSTPHRGDVPTSQHKHLDLDKHSTSAFSSSSWTSTSTSATSSSSSPPSSKKSSCTYTSIPKKIAVFHRHQQWQRRIDFNHFNKFKHVYSNYYSNNSSNNNNNISLSNSLSVSLSLSIYILLVLDALPRGFGRILFLEKPTVCLYHTEVQNTQLYAQRLGFAQALQRRGFPFPNKCWCNFTIFLWEKQQRY